MTQDELEALLGRTLTPNEVTNLTLYLNIAKESLEDLTCLNLEEATEDRVYDVRHGFTTVFTDLFTTINSVEINGQPFTDYTVRQWNRRNASWYNSIVLETTADEVTINANWGMYSEELNLLQARLFDLIGKTNKGNGNVNSKSVEDFSINFKDSTVFDQFCVDNRSLIDKYSICNMINIQHGEVVNRRYLDVPYDNYPYRSRIY